MVPTDDRLESFSPRSTGELPAGDGGRASLGSSLGTPKGGNGGSPSSTCAPILGDGGNGAGSGSEGDEGAPTVDANPLCHTCQQCFSHLAKNAGGYRYETSLTRPQEGELEVCPLCKLIMKAGLERREEIPSEPASDTSEESKLLPETAARRLP